MNVVLLGDLNERVGNEVVEGVMGRWGVEGVNLSGERMVELCTERELCIGNSYFKKKVIHKYTWIRNAHGRIVNRAVMDYVMVLRRVLKDLLDVRVLRGVGSGISDHFFVEGRMRVKMSANNRRRKINGISRKVLKVSELSRREKVEEYQERQTGEGMDTGEGLGKSVFEEE